MVWRSRRSFIVLLQGFSLRRRVASSLALVRLILVPVIFTAVYYLFAMASIVDRIVNVDAPVARNAERRPRWKSLTPAGPRPTIFSFTIRTISLATAMALHRLGGDTIQQSRKLQPEEQPTFDEMDGQVAFYRSSFDHAVRRLGESNLPPIDSLRSIVRNYQKDLDDVLTHSTGETRTRLIEMLRARIESFDTEVAAKVEENDPEIRQTSRDLATASQRIATLSSDLEKRGWRRVQKDHERARALLIRAEIIGGIISFITLLVSIWVSFVLRARW